MQKTNEKFEGQTDLYDYVVSPFDQHYLLGVRVCHECHAYAQYRASVNVTNTGHLPGAAVPQLVGHATMSLSI